MAGADDPNRLQLAAAAAAAAARGGSGGGAQWRSVGVSEVLWGVAALLCGWMVFWIFGFPATAFTGTSAAGGRQVGFLQHFWAERAAEGKPLPTPVSLVLKYAAFPSVRLLVRAAPRPRRLARQHAARLSTPRQQQRQQWQWK